MCEVVKSMSDEEMATIAGYYAEKPFVAASQEFDAAKAANGKIVHDTHCEKCHKDGGSNPDKDAGILAGQWTEYLQQSFADYASGDRAQSKTMKRKIDKLAEGDTELLIHYYASQQ